MPLRIEDYALIGDCQTAALVGRDGSIDWLCLPRFDSGACFAALLGGPEHGRWLLAPRAPGQRVTRAYRDGSLILDTTFETDDAAVVVTDCMPLRDAVPHIVRIVRGVRGRMPMRTELVVRFDYGSIVPWVRKTKGGGIRAIAGPDSMRLQSDVPLRGENLTTVAEFDVAAGDDVSFVLTWHPSHVERASRGRRAGPGRRHREGLARVVRRSAPTRAPSATDRPAVAHHAQGAHAHDHGRHRRRADDVAAGGRSAGPRNWDYRYCWVRDATFTLLALIHNGFTRRGARLARVAPPRRRRAIRRSCRSCTPSTASGASTRRRSRGSPATRGRRPCASATPRYQQRQLDVYGEVMDALYQCHTHGLPARRATPGTCGAGCSSSSRRAGTSPTRASGRCAGPRASSRTRR